MGAEGAALIRAHYRVEDLGRTFAALITRLLHRRDGGAVATG